MAAALAIALAGCGGDDKPAATTPVVPSVPPGATTPTVPPTPAETAPGAAQNVQECVRKSLPDATKAPPKPGPALQRQLKKVAEALRKCAEEAKKKAAR